MDLDRKLFRPQPGKSLAPPAHVAIIMDGNRRWARKRLLPAAMGHAAGARRVRDVVATCIEQGVQCLSLFAFSTENWRRPADEVSALMLLFSEMLQREVQGLVTNGVRLRVLGDKAGFSAQLQQLIDAAELATAQGSRLQLNICANYGGRWDVLQAVKAWQQVHPGVPVGTLVEADLEPFLSTGLQPPVDLLIRTGGEQRISNFMLWQAAYAELFFTSVLWPEFRPSQLKSALQSYMLRDRRFGTSSPADVGGFSA